MTSDIQKIIERFWPIVKNDILYFRNHAGTTSPISLFSK